MTQTTTSNTGYPTPLTYSNARRWSRLLVEWGFYGVQIIESVPSGEVRIKGINRCGQTRVIANRNEFIAVREESAGAS
jgi:hypothetical protein